MLNENQRAKIKSALLQVNMSEKEITIYISALQLGESSIPLLAESTGFSRGTIYDLVEKLKNRGFLAEIKKGKKRRFVPESPTNKLYRILDTRQDQFKKMQREIDDVLPILQSINVKEDFKPQIRTYFGEKGFRQVWDEIFTCKEKKWVGIARIETFEAFCGSDFLIEIQKRKAKLGFSSLAINEDSESARKMKAEDEQYNRKTRLAPKRFSFPSTEVIFGNKVAMFSTDKENIILVIESRDFANSHRAYFEMMWEFLENQQKEE